MRQGLEQRWAGNSKLGDPYGGVHRVPSCLGMAVTRMPGQPASPLTCPRQLLEKQQPPLPSQMESAEPKPGRSTSYSLLKRMLFGRPQDVVKISWATLQWRTVILSLKPSLCLVQVYLPLASLPPGVLEMKVEFLSRGTCWWDLPLAGWDAVRLNSLPNKALVTKLLNS